MRLSFVFLGVFCLYVCKCFSNPTSASISYLPLNNFYSKGNTYHRKKQTGINIHNIPQILFLALGLCSLLWLSLLKLCTQVNYVTFNTNLCTRRKAITADLSDCFWLYLSLITLGLLFCECLDYPLQMFIIFINSSYESVVNILLKFRKIVSRTIFSILSIYIYSIVLTPATCILSLMIFQVWCHAFTIHVPPWLPPILILLSNDIHLDPGPHFQNSFLNFMLWNLNSLAKDNFNVFASLKPTTRFSIMT